MFFFKTLHFKECFFYCQNNTFFKIKNLVNFYFLFSVLIDPYQKFHRNLNLNPLYLENNDLNFKIFISSSENFHQKISYKYNYNLLKRALSNTF